MSSRLLLLLLVLGLTSCHFGRFIIYNFADITDYKKFPQKKIEKKGEPFLFYEGENKFSARIDSIKLTSEKKGEMGLTDYLDQETKTVAFMVIKNDSIIYEQYFEKYGQSSIVTSFSVAKSIISALVGIAIEEGHIKNTDEPITNYIPELKNEDLRFEKITIEHALNMRTGLKFNENTYTNPFAEIAKLYYGRDHLGQVIDTKIEEPANTSYEYQSINTQILAIIIERATKRQLANYFEEKIWQPLGMEYDASWNVDSKKHETPKGYCCLNARTRDFAKLGRLYLNNGNWDGKQIVNEDWVKKSVEPNLSNGCYQYQWYSRETNKTDVDGEIIYYQDSLTATKELSSQFQTARASSRYSGQYYVEECGPAFMAIGILGQYIYVDPKQDLIMVRFGKKSDFNYRYLFSRIGELIKEVS